MSVLTLKTIDSQRLLITGNVLIQRGSSAPYDDFSDFSSDIVTRYPAALGVVAASAGCWSPVFTGAE